MKKKNNTHQLWVEKYRPQNINDILLPTNIKEKFINFEENPQNLLLCGAHGTGKSTLANILTKNVSVLKINASLTNGIDTIRSKIEGFVSTNSIRNRNSKKVVWLDEADNFTEAGQKALRGFIETHHRNAIFILTANYPEKIINPLKSRLMVVEFDFADSNDTEQQKNYFKRILGILKLNNLTISKDAIKYLMKEHYPDMRSIIKTLQFISSSMKPGARIEIDHISKISINKYEEFYKFICSEFRPDAIYTYVKSNFLNKEADVIKSLGGGFLNYLDQNNMQHKILPISVIIQKYQYELPNSIDKLVCLLACCSSMSNTLK